MFLLLFLFNAKSSFAYYQREDFHQKYYWLTRPNIVLCDDAKVSKFNLSQAIFFWNRVGYGVSTEIVEKTCLSDYAHGEIRVTSQRDLDLQKYYGFTERKISESILYAATIKVEDASSNSVKLIIHELGHALGIEHSHHDRGHIMHPHVMDEDTRFE